MTNEIVGFIYFTNPFVQILFHNKAVGQHFLSLVTLIKKITMPIVSFTYVLINTNIRNSFKIQYSTVVVVDVLDGAEVQAESSSSAPAY